MAQSQQAQILNSQLSAALSGIYQAEVCHLSHAYILLIMTMRLLEVVIPNITFKFGANNINFIRVRLGQVRLGPVRLGYIVLILMLFGPQINIIFAISTSNNPIISKIYA